MRKQYIVLKQDLNAEDLLYMHPNLFALFSFISSFCWQHGVAFHATSLHRTPEENIRAGAKTRTHVEDRAFDFSTKAEHGWTEEKLDKLENEVNILFKDVGALAWVDEEKTKLVSRPIVIHKVENGATHGHVQVRPN